MTAIPEIMDAKSLGGFRVWIRFQGGLQGDVDLSGYTTFGPVFEPLAEESFFKKFTIHGWHAVLAEWGRYCPRASL